MIKLNTRIGKYTLQIEFNDMKQLHKFGSVYGNLPSKCTACGSDDIHLSYKNPKGNDYYTLACGECKADANFGIKKDNGGLFWKDEKMTVYVSEGGDSSQHQGNAEQGVKDAQAIFGPESMVDDEAGF